MIPGPEEVFVVQTARGYDGSPSLDAPELLPGTIPTPALAAVRELLHRSGFDAGRFGSPSWNPLGDLIRPHSRVLIKPNWVSHANASGAGNECLVTHPTIIEAILEYAVIARPSHIVVGDAPVQGCHFEELCRVNGLHGILARIRKRGVPVALEDFRLVTIEQGLSGRTGDTSRTPAQYILFDLGTKSFLEPISAGNPRFRVTMYDPRALESTHGPGRHQYLIAREAIDADVVINLPKLKTHKKACITGTLKNMVGINGHKSYLPHHRKGGSASGGDCYEGNGSVKALTEHVLDIGNAASPGPVRTLCSIAVRATMRIAGSLPSRFDLEGSWHGNDTVWRTALDIQRILRYGDLRGSLCPVPQRTILNITDAIVGGEGEGPLSPTPVNLRFLTLGMNAASVEWINASLMGMDPAAVPLTRNAFSSGDFPIAGCAPQEVHAMLGSEELSPSELFSKMGSAVVPAQGWKGHCEWRRPHASVA